MGLQLRAASGLLHDIRYGFRQCRRNAALSVVVIVSLALGIGANTAIFSLVNAVMLRELPVRDPARLVVLQYAEPQGGLPGSLDHTHSGRSGRDSAGRSVSISISWPSFTYLQARAQSMSSFVGFVPLGMFDRPTAVVNGEPTFLDADMVTAGFFPTLGVPPIRGRAILPDDEKPGAPRVGVMSYRFWSRAYARSEVAIGRTITLNGVPVTLVGVAPPEFTGLEIGRAPDIWIQMGPQPGLTPWGVRPRGAPQVVYAAPDYWWLEVVGRLKPGVTTEQARLEVERLFRESLRASVNTQVPDEKLPSVVLTPATVGLNAISQRYSTPLSIPP